MLIELRLLLWSTLSSAMNKDTHLTYFLILMAMVSPVALNIVAPIMPVLAKEFDAPSNIIQLSFTAYLATLAIGQLLGGPIADRYGKRKLLLWGFGLHILGGGVGVFASSVELIILSRIMQAAGGCIGMMLARSILVDMYPSEKAVEKLSYITMGVAVSQAVAPTVGGVVSEYAGWYSVFYMPMLMAATVWLGVFLQYPKAISDEKSLGKATTFIGTYRTLLANRAYVVLALSSTLIACGFFSFVTCAPFIVTTSLGESLSRYGFWFLFVALGFMLGSLVSGRFSSRYSHSKMVMTGHVLSLVAAVAMLIFMLSLDVRYDSLFLTMALFTFGRGLSQPHLQSLSIAAVEVNRASASGLLGFIQLLLGALFAQLVGMAVEHLGFVMLALFLVGFAACALLLYLHYQHSYLDQKSACSVS